MSLWSRLTGKAGHDIDELARRLGIDAGQLSATRPAYTEFTIPKRSGGTRRILAPSPDLKALQRQILRRLLDRLKVHSAATGFQKGHSIVTNAVFHAGRAVVVHMDIRDFFASTRAKRVTTYFKKIGWNREAANLLATLCCHDGGLPQGAPTSPRLSNLVNYRLDTRLTGVAATVGALYSRYADDMTFSFGQDNHQAVEGAIWTTKQVLADEGYKLHTHKKLHIRRRHQRQVVTGLVVNNRVDLPRETRRWLRAVEHHAATGQPTTLTPEQLSGWRALRQMIDSQGRA
jgi:RNA-directed DNA polymerase